jgi:hypothetical protein
MTTIGMSLNQPGRNAINAPIVPTNTGHRRKSLTYRTTLLLLSNRTLEGFALLILPSNGF